MQIIADSQISYDYPCHGDVKKSQENSTQLFQQIVTDPARKKRYIKDKKLKEARVAT